MKKYAKESPTPYLLLPHKEYRRLRIRKVIFQQPSLNLYYIASLEDKMIYGLDNSPLQRLYKRGNRNLIGIARSDVPETLVNVLAESSRSKDTIVAVIEAIADTAVYIENAEKFTIMGVMKDLIRFISEAPDFRSYIVHISIEAIWNMIEVVG
jgi:hypothetical protein